MKKRIALLLVLALALTSVFVGCGKEVTEDAKEKFVVGFDQDFPPMGFVGDDGEYTGFDLELAEEVAKRLDMEFVPQPITWGAKDS